MKLNPESLASASSRHPWRTLGAWLVFIVLMGVVSASLLAGVLTDDMAFTNEPESDRAQEVIDASFADSTRDTEFMVVSSPTHRTHEDPYAAFVTDLQAEIQGLGPEVVGAPVTSYVDAAEASAQLFTPDLHGVLVLVQTVPGASTLLAELQRAVPGSAPKGYEARLLGPEELAEMFPAELGPAPLDPPEAVVLVQTIAVAPDTSLAEAVRAVETTIARRGGSELAAPPTAGSTRGRSSRP
jgi:uncharacterized membrane protein YdfJ with MMPL/SSD domain